MLLKYCRCWDCVDSGLLGEEGEKVSTRDKQTKGLEATTRCAALNNKVGSKKQLSKKRKNSVREDFSWKERLEDAMGEMTRS
jgi:hypothetical protein